MLAVHRPERDQHDDVPQHAAASRLVRRRDVAHADPRGDFDHQGLSDWAACVTVRAPSAIPRLSDREDRGCRTRDRSDSSSEGWPAESHPWEVGYDPPAMHHRGSPLQRLAPFAVPTASPSASERPDVRSTFSSRCMFLQCIIAHSSAGCGAPGAWHDMARVTEDQRNASSPPMPSVEADPPHGGSRTPRGDSLAWEAVCPRFTLSAEDRRHRRVRSRCDGRPLRGHRLLDHWSRPGRATSAAPSRTRTR
jgi:hypothetical protein